MKREDLFKKAAEITSDVLSRNNELVKAEIQEAFKADDGSNMLPLDQALSKATVLCLTMAPRLSAAVTAQILVDLGLVTLEEDE